MHTIPNLFMTRLSWILSSVLYVTSGLHLQNSEQLEIQKPVSTILTNWLNLLSKYQSGWGVVPLSANSLLEVTWNRGRRQPN